MQVLSFVALPFELVGYYMFFNVLEAEGCEFDYSLAHFFHHAPMNLQYD